MVATRRKRAADGSSSEVLDARTTAEYKLYQGRVYVNCTTFPSV